MGAILDSLIKYKQLEQYQDQDLRAIPQALNTFVQARDNAMQMQQRAVMIDLEKKKMEAEIASLVGETEAKRTQASALDRMMSGGAGLKLKSIDTTGKASYEPIETEEQIQAGIDAKVKEKKALEAENPPSQAQETSSLYANRLVQAEKVFKELAPELKSLGLGSTVMSGKVGPLGVPNWLKSDNAQSYEQAKRNFLTAVLRKESGAVISPSEMQEGNLQYFPQPGDKGKVFKQKEDNRKAAIKGMIASSGKAYKDSSSGEISEEDIQHTLKLHPEYTREKLLKKLGR